MIRLRLITRIALFSALIYVLSWGTSYFPNLNFIFFIVFVAGFLWGVVPGMLVGLIGMGLWTAFNPYGMAVPPIMLAQMLGASAGGVVGAWLRCTDWQRWSSARRIVILVLSSIACTLLFYIPVNFVDAWVFQPFWPRFVAGMLWTVISLGFNAVIFPLLFKVAVRLYVRENPSG